MFCFPEAMHVAELSRQLANTVQNAGAALRPWPLLDRLVVSPYGSSSSVQVVMEIYWRVGGAVQLQQYASLLGCNLKAWKLFVYA